MAIERMFIRRQFDQNCAEIFIVFAKRGSKKSCRYYGGIKVSELWMGVKKGIHNCTSPVSAKLGQQFELVGRYSQ